MDQAENKAMCGAEETAPTPDKTAMGVSAVKKKAGKFFKNLKDKTEDKAVNQWAPWIANNLPNCVYWLGGKFYMPEWLEGYWTGADLKKITRVTVWIGRVIYNLGKWLKDKFIAR